MSRESYTRCDCCKETIDEGASYHRNVEIYSNNVHIWSRGDVCENCWDAIKMIMDPDAS